MPNDRLNEKATLDVLNEILESSPDSAALVTSREALRLYGEQEYPVASLPVGNGQLGPAVQLFI